MDVSTYQAIIDKQYAAFLVSLKKAIRCVFGKEAGHLAQPLDGEVLDQFCETLFAQAGQQAGHATAQEAEEALYEYEEDIGKDVPYHEAFYEEFPQTVAQCGLAFIEDQLRSQCRRWEGQYAFFNAAEGGYQLLHDLLIDAQYHKEVEDTPSVSRAIHWLARQAAQPVDSPALDAHSFDKPRQRQEAGPVQLFGITIEQVRSVLEECGVSAASRAGQWAAISSALRRLGMLKGAHTAVQRWLTAEFGAPDSIRRTLSDKGERYSVFSDKGEKHVLETALDSLRKHRKEG